MRTHVDVRSVVLLTLVAALIPFATSPAMAKAEGNVNFFLGQKMLDDDDWETLDDQLEYGVETTFGGDNWPVHIAVDLLMSQDDEEERVLGVDVDIEGSTRELAVGVRKVWEFDRARPYVGGGLTQIDAEVEFELPGGAEESDDDSEVGPWIGGGVFWRLGPNFNIGVSGRYSNAEVSIFDTDVEAGGIHIGVLAGFGWPASR